jgi:glycosyltransferase involved in cell wall biosynthesis
MMHASSRKPRLAVVSPSLDKRHGTERRAVEWISQIASAYEIHVYSQHVEDLDVSTIRWHRIPTLPGPHLFNFMWWIAANRIWRVFDSWIRNLQFDLVFSPGVNSLDADVVSIHIVFGEYSKRVASTMRFRHNPIFLWPRLAHRKIYYRLLIWLERKVYVNPDTVLVLIAKKTGEEIERHYHRKGPFAVLYLGLDHSTFNQERCSALRGQARASIGLSQDRFVLLIVGNDWRNKGVPVLLDAIFELSDLSVDLLVVSLDDLDSCRTLIRARHLEGRVRFLPQRPDIEFYYAAADAYAGPSLEDTFAQPPAEAMACGLPVIVSSANGTSEIITDGLDGLILQDPSDARTLAAMIRKLYADPEYRKKLGQNAAESTRKFTWERNGRELARILEDALKRKEPPSARSLAQEL